MKKLLSLFLIPLLLCGCTVEREDYYIFSFGDYTIAPGYDDAEYLELIFELDLPETLEPNETLEKKEVHFWGDYLADVDLSNDGKKTIPIGEAKVTRFVLYLANFPDAVYRIDGQELSPSVRENCEKFSGEYIERNGYACVFGKKSGKKKNVVILYGDLFAIDQDALDHVEIYVE
ncbi:MAG: hypothetical protein IIZ28_08395 [Erysipelotrichaceae bacterium]|nr:hypothetical protein [Erysipelotrichaceae bacterium]